MKMPNRLILQPTEVDAIVEGSSPLEHFPDPQPQFRAGFPHQLALALETGSQSDPHRPPLPIEVILPILHLCGFSRPARHLSLQWDFGEDGEKEVFADSAEVAQAACFVLPECDRKTRAHMSQLQVFTVSRDQGWVGDPEAGSWSWFELCILTRQPHEETGEIQWLQKCRKDGKRLSWVSHHNKMAGDYAEKRHGRPFGPDAEVWKMLEDGDRPCVTMCSQFASWGNIVKGGEIRIWQWFEPSEESERFYKKWIKARGKQNERLKNTPLPPTDVPLY